LIKETKNPDAKIRKQAVRHLGDLKEAKFIPVLESIFKNKNESPDVLYAAIVALEKLKDQPIVEALKLATQTNSAQIRMHAAKLLGQLKAEDSVLELIRLLADTNDYVKNIASKALIRIGEPSIDPLIAVLDSGARNVIPDKDAKFIAEYQYIANAYIDDARLAKRRIATQAAVIQALGALKAKKAIRRLITLLDHDNLHGSVSSALTTMAGAAVPELIEAMRNENDNIRIEVAETLSAIGDRRAIDTFLEALQNDPRKEIQAIVAKALGNMRVHGVNDSAIPLLTEALKLDDTTATNAATALGQIKISTDQTIKMLIAMAMDKRGRETVRNAALFALSQLKPVEAVQPMILLMLSDETSPVIRKGAVTALGEIKSKETVSVLLWVLSTRHDDIKDFQRRMKREYKTLDGLRAAIETLSIQWTPEYPKPTYRTWGELKPIPSLVRSEVATSLGKIKGDEVIEPLTKALKDDGRAAVRRSAAWALGEIKGDTVIGPLTDALKKDKQGIVRQEAAVALGEVAGDKVIAPLLTALKKDKFETTRTKAAIALRVLNKKLADGGLVDVLQKGVGSFEEDREVQSVQDEVIGALVKEGNATTTNFLLDALKSADDEWTRWAIVHILGTIKTKSAVDSILQELEHPSYIVRKEAAATLGNYKDRKTVAPLIKMVENKNEAKSIRASAIASLGTLRDEQATPILLSALDDENAEVRLRAATALGTIQDANAVDKLIEILQNLLEDKSLREACVSALGLIGDKKAEPAILNVLRTEYILDASRIKAADIYLNAITALGKLETTEAVPELIAILEDRSVEDNARKRAATALAAIGDARATSPIANRLVDETEYVVEFDVDLLKRNYTWEVFAAAAKSFQLPASVAPKLIERVDSTWEDNPIKKKALAALGRCNTPQTVAKLKEQIASPKAGLRVFSARTVGETKRGEFKDNLVKMAKGEDEPNHDVRRAATQGLGELGDASTVSELIGLLNDDSNHVEIRRDAAIALGKIGGDAAVSALIDKLRILQESKTVIDLRRDIIKGLIEAKSQKVVSILKTTLEDEDADIHFLAANALFQITGDGHGYHRVD